MGWFRWAWYCGREEETCLVYGDCVSGGRSMFLRYPFIECENAQVDIHHVRMCLARGACRSILICSDLCQV